MLHCLCAKNRGCCAAGGQTARLYIERMHIVVCTAAIVSRYSFRRQVRVPRLTFYWDDAQVYTSIEMNNSSFMIASIDKNKYLI